MVAYPKKRTVRHGLRLTPQHKIAENLQEPAKRAIKIAKKILADSKPLEKRESFLLTQMLIAAERFLAPPELKEKFRQEIEKRTDNGERLKFSVLEISGMNAAVFLIDNEDWLHSFVNQAKEKLGIK